MKKITALLTLLFFSLGFFVAKQTYASGFSQASLRLESNKANAPLSGTVCAKPSTAGAGNEAKVSINFPTDFDINSSASTWTTDTSSLPAGSVAWPGVGANATAVSGRTVTFGSSDLTNGSSLYCFNFTSTSNTGSTGNKLGILTTKNSSNSEIDSSDLGLSIIDNDQIVVSATVPADNSDYTTTLNQIDPPSGNNIFSQNTEILYKITYATTLSYPSAITLEASWTQGTIENQSSPSIDIADYIVGSASNANSTPPVIDTVNRTITWTISPFPANTTNQTVTFRLKTLNNYLEKDNVSFSVSARILFAGGAGTPSTLAQNYKYSTSQGSSGNSPSPTPTPKPNSKPQIQEINTQQISQDKATIFIRTNTRTSKIIRYGASINNLDKQVSAKLSNDAYIAITGLTTNTKYYYRVYVSDANGKQTTSDFYTFTTAKDSQPLLANPLTLVAISNNMIISDNNPTIKNILVIPFGSVFQFKFETLNKISANSIMGIIRNEKVLGSYSFIKKAGASTDSTNLIEIEKGVYSGNLQTNSIPGSYGLYVRIADSNGNITEQEISKIKVINKFRVLSSKDKKSIEGSRVLIYVFNPSSKTYQVIPSSTIEQGNPLFTDSAGYLDLVLPQGKYKAEVSDIFYKDQTVEFEINQNTEGFPTVELERTGITPFGLFNYYKRGVNDVFIYNTQAYSEALTGSTRFFDLVSMVSLAGVIILTVFAFSRRHRIPVSYIPSYFYYLVDRKDRSEKYIHGVIYDEKDNPIPGANVYLTDKKNEEIISHTKTNKEGEFYFRKGKSEYLLMAMAKNYDNSPTFEYHERKHLKFKINLKEKDTGLNLLGRVNHYFGHFLGLSFEVLLLVSFILEILFLNSFGVAKTLPFLVISTFNLVLWILHLHNKSHTKVVF